MDTGTQIKAYLESSGISQKYISDKTSIPPVKLNLALNGKRRLTFEEYSLICWALGVSADRFITPHPPKSVQTS